MLLPLVRARRCGPTIFELPTSNVESLHSMIFHVAVALYRLLRIVLLTGIACRLAGALREQTQRCLRKCLLVLPAALADHRSTRMTWRFCDNMFSKQELFLRQNITVNDLCFVRRSCVLGELTLEIYGVEFCSLLGALSQKIPLRWWMSDHVGALLG